MPRTSAIGTCGEGSMASSRRKRLRRERQAGDGEARVERAKGWNQYNRGSYWANTINAKTAIAY